MSLEEQLKHIKQDYPEAWEFLHSPPDLELPKFNDNDEMITREEIEDESIH